MTLSDLWRSFQVNGFIVCVSKIQHIMYQVKYNNQTSSCEQLLLLLYSTGRIVMWSWTKTETFTNKSLYVGNDRRQAYSTYRLHKASFFVFSRTAIGIAIPSVLCNVGALYADGWFFRNILRHIVAWPSGLVVKKTALKYSHPFSPRGGGLLCRRGYEKSRYLISISLYLANETTNISYQHLFSARKARNSNSFAIYRMVPFWMTSVTLS